MVALAVARDDLVVQIYGLYLELALLVDDDNVSPSSSEVGGTYLDSCSM